MAKDVNNRKTIYSELVKINELLENEGEAFDWLKKYSTLSDSLSGVRMKETVGSLEARYSNSEIKDRLPHSKAKNLKKNWKLIKTANMFGF